VGLQQSDSLDYPGVCCIGVLESRQWIFRLGRICPLSDYLDVDLTLLHKFGKWRLGPVGYAEWAPQTIPTNAAVGKAFAAQLSTGVTAGIAVPLPDLRSLPQAVFYTDGHGE
jgi:hypothetical protein